MQKKFFSNLIWLIFFNLLIKPYAIFGIDAEVQNRVGTETYGMYFTLLNFTLLFNILLDLGITNYNTRYVAQYPRLVKRYFGNMLSLKLILFLLYTIFTLLIAYFLGVKQVYYWFVILLIVNQFLINMLQFLRSYFAGLLLFKWDIFLSVLDRIVMIGVVSVLLYAPWLEHQFKIEWFIYAQLFSFGLSVFVAFVLVLWKVGIPRFQIGKLLSYAILKKSFPFALLVLLMMLYSRMDALMLERLHVYGHKQVGLYAQSYRMLDASLMFIMMFSNLLYPIFSRMIKERSDVKPLLTSSSKLVFAFTSILSITCGGFAWFILKSIYDHDVDLAVPTFRMLMLSVVPTAMVLILGTYLTANGSLKKLNIFSFVGLVLNIVFNFILIPKHGSFGAAVSTLIGQSMILVLYLISIWKMIDFQFKWNEALRFVVYVGLLGASYLLSFMVKNQFLQLTGFVILAGTIGLLVGMIPLKSIVHSLKNEK
jgi:O-antigen/teichoic acid export membrane protein